MYNTLEEWKKPIRRNSWIIFPGQLVRIQANCFEQIATYGIIIGCETPHFGVGYDDNYSVLIDGDIVVVKNFQIYPVT